MTASLPDLSRRVIDFTAADLQTLLATAIDEALRRQKKEQEGEVRYTTARAASFLGCTPGHLQKLHTKGLPYEKGRPNMYRLADLQQQRATQRLLLTT